MHVPGLTWPVVVVGTLSASFSTLYAGETSPLFNSSSSSSSTGRFITLLSTSVVTADSAELVTVDNNRLVVSTANVLLHVTGLSSNSRGLQNNADAVNENEVQCTIQHMIGHSEASLSRQSTALVLISDDQSHNKRKCTLKPSLKQTYSG